MSTVDTILTLISEHGITKNKLLLDLGLGKNSFVNWTDRGTSPSGETLSKIADYFNVSVDYLLGRTASRQSAAPSGVSSSVESSIAENPTAKEQIHIKKYRSLDDYGKEAVDSILDVEYRRMEAIKTAQSSNQTEVSSEIIPELPKVIPLFISAAAAGIASPVLGEDYEDYVLKKDDPQSAILAVRVQGDSMEPYFPDGSIVFCDKTPMQIGDIGVFILDGGSLLKQWCVDNYGNAYLFSLNRKRADADVTVRHSSGQTLTCMGRVITHNRFPLPV